MYNVVSRATKGLFMAAVLLLPVSLLPAENPDTSSGPAIKAPAPGPQEYALEEFSVFEEKYKGKFEYQLTGGQPADELTSEPSAALKALPPLKSSKPLYGKITFGDFLFEADDCATCYFALDESQGQGNGYDTLYADLDGDLDLTNDTPVKRAAKAPVDDRPDSIFFEAVKIAVNFPKSGASVIEAMPVLRSYGPDFQRVSFVVPTGRRGTVTVGTQQVQAILAQCMPIRGRFDGKLTALFLDQNEDLVPCLGAVRKFGDTLYEFSATPSGDKLTVRAYAGQYGELKLRGGDKVVIGVLMDKQRVINLSDCLTQDGRHLVPAGDYAPIRVGIDSDNIRYGLSADIAGPGEEAFLPLVYSVKIRNDERFVLTPGKDCLVKFKSPAAGRRYCPGDSFNAEAMLYDPSLGVMIAGLEDKSKPRGEVTLPDGTEMQMYESIDAEVKILTAAGRTIAEGKMPFG